MYKLGRRPHHRQKLYALLILAFAGLIIAAAWALNNYLQPNTSFSESEAIVRHVGVATPPTKTINTSIFSMSIPKSWHVVTPSYIPAAQYAWRGVGQEDSARSLELYVDNIPAAMAVNKLLPLRANGNRIVVGDTISDNCTSFTDSAKADKRTGKMLAKWSEVNFYCDTSNYTRNVIGTGSPGLINSVSLDGPAAGVHNFFFIYTDNSAEPDYTIFTNILSSFRVH